MTALQFVAQLLLTGEDEAIFGGEDLLAFLKHGVADEGVVFIGAENDAERRVVALAAFQVVEKADIHVHLSDVGMAKLFRFEIEQDEALEQVVVEDEVHIEVAGLRADTELPPDEGKAFPHLHEEIPQTVGESGFEIALACDIIIASDQAKFALPEPKVGLAAGAGGMQRLSRMIPLKKAMGMMLTGRHVPAKEGYELGFVTQVVPHADLMKEARRWADEILACSPMSVRATKQVVMRSLDVPALEMAMRNLNYPAFVAMTKSEDTVEGPRAFAQKRKPDWKGR